LELVGCIKDKEYSYYGQEARCDDCGLDIHVPEVRDSNLRALYDVYRREHGIISLCKICDLPHKYGIAKRPLSLLLGWGELTYSRYVDGKVPAKQYSDELERLYSSPEYYLAKLERNKNLISDVAYRKSRQAVDAILYMGMDRNEKINIMAAYILHKCEDITALALQKTLYYAQGFYHAFYGDFLFADDCEAWVHGPAYRGVYGKYKEYRFEPIKETSHFDESILSEQEISVLNCVIKYFCCYSGKVLEDMTHTESPWLETRGALQPSALSNRIIEKDIISAYFDKIKAKYQMITPVDIGAYARDKFMEVHG
jgi:uncharacterized phage-associated protein